jgi:hypothetical protein
MTGDRLAAEFQGAAGTGRWRSFGARRGQAGDDMSTPGGKANGRSEELRCRDTLLEEGRVGIERDASG